MPRSLTTHIDSPKEVGQRLKASRERAGLSQRQLAFPGCTAAYISRLEAGARRAAVSAPHVHALCLAQLALIALEDNDWEGANRLITRARAQVARYIRRARALNLLPPS